MNQLMRRREVETEFNNEHFALFRDASEKGKWPAKDPAVMANRIGLSGLCEAVRAQPLDRRRLAELVSDGHNVSDHDVLWAILLWGGVNFANGPRLVNSDLSPLVEEVGKLRNGHSDRPDRASAYAGMSQAIASNGIRGIAPAFYTKLIFFSAPKLNGYIMDQWTARSVNLICREPFIRITKNGWVEPRNTPEIYEKFRQTVDRLTLVCGFGDAEETEMRLFGTGGIEKNACSWRKHVRKLPVARPISKKGSRKSPGEAQGETQAGDSAAACSVNL
jgi:hypothetical protein